MPDHDVLSAGDRVLLAQERSLGDAGADGGHCRRARDGDIAAPSSGRPFESRSSAIPAPKKVTPEKVLQSFNTWHFKREQPADPHLMLQIISEAIGRREPVPFVLYWGKGPRCTLGEPDTECLDFLAALADRVRDAYEPGAAIKLIFTDTHAELNGHAQQSIRKYFAEVEAGARQRGFDACRLGQLIRASEAVAANDLDDEDVPQDTLQRLSAGARKWYHGAGTAEQGALIYYRMNMVERRAVEIAFPRSIFVTFNGSKFRGLFPKHLPIFFMYSLRRGVSVKPWFLPVDATPCDDSACHCVAHWSRAS